MGDFCAFSSLSTKVLMVNHRYTYQQVRELLFSIKEIANEDIEETIDLFLRNCGKVGIDYGKAK